MLKFSINEKPPGSPFIPAGILLIILLTGCVSTKRLADNRPFFFIQLSDPQIGFYPDSTQKEIASYEKAVAAVNRLRPDFVVITGDLVNREHDQGQLAAFKRVTARIDSDIPVYYTPGNHDVGNNPTADDVSFYKSLYGYDRFSFTHKGSLFIGYNSSLMRTNIPKLEGGQYRWLEDELKKGKHARHIVLFCHIPLFISMPDEPDLYYDKEKTEGRNIPGVVRQKYLDLFDQYHVDALFAGHLHQNAYGKYKNMEMITTSAVGEALGKDPRGMRIIKVTENGISNHFYSLDSIPDHIEQEN